MNWVGRNGEGGIRTHGGSHLAGFQDQSHKPLDHLSRGSAPEPSRRWMDFKTAGWADQFSGLASGSRHLSESQPAGPASLISPTS